MGNTLANSSKIETKRWKYWIDNIALENEDSPLYCVSEESESFQAWYGCWEPEPTTRDDEA